MGSESRIAIEKDRLAWVRQNLLLRVERSAADGLRISTWMVTGSAAVFVLALKEQLALGGIEIPRGVLDWLFSAFIFACMGAATGYWVGTEAVKDFNRGVNATEDLVRALIVDNPAMIAKAECAVSCSGHGPSMGAMNWAAVGMNGLAAACLARAAFIAMYPSG